MSVVVFIYSDREDVMNGDVSCAGGAFKLLVPEPICYSVHNLLQDWDTVGIINFEKPSAIVACGTDAATCLEFDGVSGFIVAPDITMPNWSRKKCVDVGVQVQSMCEGS